MTSIKQRGSPFDDRWSGPCRDYDLSDRKARTIITVPKHLFEILKRQYDIELNIVEADNELNPQKPEVKAYLILTISS